MKGVTTLRKLYSILISFLLIFTLLPGNHTIKAENHDVDLWNVLKPLDTTISFVNVGAHPDDERSDLLAYLSRGLGVQTSSLIANRGEGGQNQIGVELGNTLGIIRSMEMKEAAKVNGVEAFHLSETTSDSIYDFGFSKTAEETFEFWGEEITRERFIRFIRTYRPDIIMPTFRDVPSQHGHHRAMSILGVEAFKDAADPNVFPEQLNEGLSVWQAKKLYLPAESPESADFSVEIGDYDEIYGMTYPQLGEKSRYLHKSQGMGRDLPAEPRQTHFEFVDSAGLVETNNVNKIFDGIPANFSEWANVLPESESNLKNLYILLHEKLTETIQAYPNKEDVFNKSQDALDTLRELINETTSSNLDLELKQNLLHKLSIKEDQLQEANFVASQLEINMEIDSSLLTQGQTTTVEVSIKNNSNQDLEASNFNLITPNGWTVSNPKQPDRLGAGKNTTISYEVQVSDHASYFKPYDTPILQVDMTYEVNGTVVNRNLDFDETIAVLPEIGLTLTPEDIVVNTENVQDEIPVTIKVKNYYEGSAQTSVTLDVPDGWAFSPSSIEVDFSEKLEVQNVTFDVIPPEDIQEGDFNIHAKANFKGKELASTIQEIHYDHVSDSYFEYPAKVNGVAFELNTVKGLKLGYIESGFDEIPDYLINAGFNITKLTATDLATEDLNKYDTIVTGIRAYLAREDLVENNDRLNEYVENGGHLVVQHNLPAEWDAVNPAPYPLKVGRPSIEWRVTDENAKVTVLNPESPLFNYPNKINDNDWDNWVQERGLYFPMEWDDRFETLVSMADPGEDPFEGSILFAEYGEGTYLYTSLGFYRQIQNQVPGGYRIFTNLISYGNYEEVPEQSADLLLDELSGQLEEYVDSGEVSGPLVNQLQNSLKQAKHHLSKDSKKKAIDFGEKFLKHLNNKPMQKHVGEEAKVNLQTKAEEFINYLVE